MSKSHSLIGELTAKINSQASDTIIHVLQHGSPIKKLLQDDPSSLHKVGEQLQLQETLDRSLGVTATKLAHDPSISGNIQLKNELRKEMGGRPSTVLGRSGKTVGQYRECHRMRRKNSRTYRNELYDLSMDSSDSEDSLGGTIPFTNLKEEKLKTRIQKKLLEMLMNSSDELKKRKTRYAMKSLEGMNTNKSSDMVEYIFKMKTADDMITSFNSLEIAEYVVEVVDVNDLTC